MLDDVSFDVPDGAFCVLLGPSGCGKSTLLRIIAGLEDASSGELRIGDVRMNERSPKDRDIAMVFQSYALYPHLSVVDNIAFPLEARGVAKKERRERAAKVAESVQLAGLLDRRPAQLSGGQRQRVALARAIIREPRVFLFDEPLSNLDAAMRQAMRVEIRALHKRLGVTSVYVTHDQEEALALADRIVVMRSGKVRQVGSPMEIYEAPADRFVAGFVGVPAMNFVRCNVSRTQAGTQLLCGDAAIAAPQSWSDALANISECWLGVRPSALRLVRSNANTNVVRVRVVNVELLGDVMDLHGFGPSGTPMIARVPSSRDVREGDVVSMALDFSGAHAFTIDAAGDQSGTRLCGGLAAHERASAVAALTVHALEQSS